MKKILWISPFAPYDNVTHAGGKVHNYYIKRFKDSGRFDVTLLSLCLKDEVIQLDLDKYGIKNDIFISEKTVIAKYYRKILNGLSYINPFDKYQAVCLAYEEKHIRKLLSNYIKSGVRPDIVIMQWTFALMLLPIIKKAFPDCFAVAIEEDVTFQSYYRMWKTRKKEAEKIFWEHRYRKEKQLELQLLQKVDMVVTNNPKDTDMLEKCGIQKASIFTSMSYFDNYININRNAVGQDILFYGAMARPENYESAIWFIKEVMSQLEYDTIRFIIVGSNPPKELLRYQSDRVCITGYVEDVSSYFSSCMCMAAPLLRGAGIKIKILEGMSAGIPILTNEVGIEGIPARNQKEFFYCEKASDYVKVIKDIINKKINASEVGQNARRFIKDNYNIKTKTDQLIELIDVITEKERMYDRKDERNMGL